MSAGFFDVPVLSLLPVRRLRRRRKEKKSEGRPGAAAPGLPSLFFLGWGGLAMKGKRVKQERQVLEAR